MRVLHTVASLRLATGGPARSVPALANALADLGIDSHIWSPEPADGFDTPPRFTAYHGNLATMEKQLGDFDLIHDHGLWLPTNHAVSRMAARFHVPRMVSPRGMLEPWALNHKKWKKKLAWWCYQRRDLASACALHATAESEADQFRNLGLKNPIYVIPNGVEVPEPRIKAHSQSATKTALFLGRIHPKKGLPLLVQAWARVKPEGWKMRVIGPDEDGHRAEVEALVAQHGLANDWQFEGALEGEQKTAAFCEADLFILPTYSENFGIAIAEALAAGVAVITTTGAPWQELVKHRCGWWVPPKIEPLACALKEALLMDEEERQQMGHRGIAWMKEGFTWHSLAIRMLAAYNDNILR
ncbi:MAG: glycosyltransferase [Chthoniobacterales bacterium]